MMVNCPPIKAEALGQMREGFWDDILAKDIAGQCFMMWRIFGVSMSLKKAHKNFENAKS